MSKHHSSNAPIVRVLKREVVGEIRVDEGGDSTVLVELSRIAMQDACESMRTDSATESEYEATLSDGSEVVVTVQHKPADIANPPMSVYEAKAALSRARAYEREQAGIADVPTTDEY